MNQLLTVMPKNELMRHKKWYHHKEIQKLLDKSFGWGEASEACRAEITDTD